MEGLGFHGPDRITAARVESAMGTFDQNAAKAAALDQIIAILADYLPPDSGVTAEDALSSIIGTIEVRHLYQFVEVTPQQ